MLLLKLLTNLKTTCVVCAKFKASKTVLLVRRIENAFFQIRQETLKGRYWGPGKTLVLTHWGSMTAPAALSKDLAYTVGYKITMMRHRKMLIAWICQSVCPRIDFLREYRLVCYQHGRGWKQKRSFADRLIYWWALSFLFHLFLAYSPRRQKKLYYFVHWSSRFNGWRESMEQLKWTQRYTKNLTYYVQMS